MNYQKYRKNWSEYPMNHIVSEFPMHLDIELTNRCNLSCEKCPYHSENALYKQKSCDMDFKLVKKIIDEGSEKGLKGIKFGFSGEPLLYPKIIKAIKYAKHKGILDVQMNSNGLLLTKDLCIDLIESGLDLFILSDYDHHKQLENGLMFYLIKALHKNPKIVVKTENVIYWQGIADEVKTHKYYDYNNPIELFDKSDFECELPWQRLLIMANGDISKCSCGSIIPEKYLGKAGVMNIEDMWLSTAMKLLRACHESHDTHIPRMCRICPARNEYIKNNK